MADQFTDVLNQYINSEPPEQVEEEPVYDATSEAQARARAFKEVQSTSQNTNEVNQLKQQINKLNSELKNVPERLKKEYTTEINNLKDIVEKLKNDHSTLKNDQSNLIEEEYRRKFKAEEDGIVNDPLYKPYYNSSSTIKRLGEEAERGRLLMPKEIMKIDTWDDLAKKLQQYEEQDANRKAILDMPFASRGNLEDKIDFSNVKDADQRMIEMTKMAKKLLGE